MTYVQKTRRQNILVIVGLIIALILVTSLNMRAQTTVIETSSVTLRLFDDEAQKWTEFSPWKTVECLIKINSTLSSVTINNKANDGFKLKSVIETNKGVDQSDGDAWTETMFNAIDREGKLCNVGIKKYNSGVYHISVMYTDVVYVYQGTEMKID